MATDPRPAAHLIDPDPLAGTAYRALAYLGQGSFGLVLEAQHVALGTIVVVKLLHKLFVGRPDLVDRLRLEAQAMSRLRSPHLTVCTDLAETPEGRPFLVLERLYGQTVADELRLRGVLPVEEAIEIARQTLAGLSVVHDAGIVHRDVKPENIFLCQDGARRLVKILDFGVAKVLAGASEADAPRPLTYPTEEGVSIGTPKSFSPEQARGAAVDARTDVYAVGVLLYTLVTGKGPFGDVAGLVNIMTAHVFTVPPPPSERAPQPIPPALDAAVMRALSKRKEDRFASAQDFSAALALVPADNAAVRPGSTGTTRLPRFDTEPLDGTGPGPTYAPPVKAARLPMRRFTTDIMPPRQPAPGPAVAISPPSTASRPSVTAPLPAPSAASRPSVTAPLPAPAPPRAAPQTGIGVRAPARLLGFALVGVAAVVAIVALVLRTWLFR